MSVIQPVKGPNSQEALVHYDNGSLEHVFAVQLTNNGNSTTAVKGLDMPLLNDLLSPDDENEMFMDDSVASVHNNPHASNLNMNEHQPTLQFDAQHLVISDSRQHDVLNESEDNVSESLSEYLVFHRKRDIATDLIAKYGCCVKLSKLSESKIASLLNPVMCDDVRAPKRRRLNSSYVPLKKKVKSNQFRRESTNNSRVSRSSSRNAPKSENTNNERVVFGAVNNSSTVTYDINQRRTGKNLSMYLSANNQPFNTPKTATARVSRSSTRIKSKCTNSDNDDAAHPINQQWTDDRAAGQPKIILRFAKDKRSGDYNCCRIAERFGVKECRVSMERLPTLQSAVPCNRKRLRECDQTSDLNLPNLFIATEIKEENSVVNDTEPYTSVIDLGEKVDASGSTSLLTDTTGFHMNRLANKTMPTCTLTQASCPNVEQRDFPDKLTESVAPNKHEETTNRLFDRLFDEIDALDFVTPSAWALDNHIDQNVDVPSILETNICRTDPLPVKIQTVATCAQSEKSDPVKEECDFPDHLNQSAWTNEQKGETGNLCDDFYFTTVHCGDSQTLDTFVNENVDNNNPQIMPTCEQNENPDSNVMERTVSPVDTFSESIGKKMNAAEALTTEGVPESVTDDNDDNCSVASDISLFASDSDTLYSPDRKKSIQPTDGWSLKKYHIPKKAPEVVQQKKKEKTWNEQVQEILGRMKNSPKIVSPISNAGSKRKRKEFRNGRTLESTSMKTKSEKPKKLIVKADDRTYQQPLESNGRTNPSEIGPDFNMNSKQQLIEFPNNGIVEEHPVEPNQTTETVDVENNGLTGAVESNRIDDAAAEHLNPSTEKSSSGEVAKLNQPEHLNESTAPSEKNVEVTEKIDTCPPSNGTTFKSKFDFSKLEKITINLSDRNTGRIISMPNVPTPSVPSFPATTVHCTVPVQSSTAPLSLQPVTFSVPKPQPISSVRNVLTHSQPATKPLHGIQRSVQGQCTLLKPLIAEFGPTPIDSVEEIVGHSQSALEPVHGTASHTAPLPQSVANTPLATQPVPVAPLMNSIQGHLITGQPDDSLSRRYLNATMNMFGRPCINFLAEKPCEMPGTCPFNHQPLPSADSIFEKMCNIREDQIEFIYKDFIAKHKRTFLQYFQHMCSLFGLRKMDGLLELSVSDCDKFERYDFFKFIFGGLLMSGKGAEEALERIGDLVDMREENAAAVIQAIREISRNPMDAISQLN